MIEDLLDACRMGRTITRSIENEHPADAVKEDVQHNYAS